MNMFVQVRDVGLEGGGGVGARTARRQAPACQARVWVRCTFVHVC